METTSRAKVVVCIVVERGEDCNGLADNSMLWEAVDDDLG
jgi:hypothetical protein